MVEDPLALAQRHVIGGEHRVAEQTNRVMRMKAHGEPEQASKPPKWCSRHCCGHLNSRGSTWGSSGEREASLPDDLPPARACRSRTDGCAQFV
jgi:hypothetical protein